MFAEAPIAARPDGGRSSRQELFLQLLVPLYDDLHSYVHSLVLNLADSEDVFQEVCVTLWTKFDEFEFGTSFRKWALAVAYHCCKGYWRDKQRDRGWALTEAVLGRVAQIYEASVEIREIRERLLEECITKLPAGDRRLIGQIYHDDVAPAAAAAERGVTANAIYSRLTRVRQKLGRCIERGMK